jgi:DICT domain-containing protein
LVVRIYFSKVLVAMSSNSAWEGILAFRKDQSKVETRLEDERIVEIYAARYS